MTARDRKILELLVKIARPKILKHFRPDSCIASTRVAIDVLDHFGITAVPRPCRAFVCTRKLWQRVKDDTFKKPFLPGEHSVGIGYPGARLQPGDKGYLGHLVALIEDVNLIDVIVDLSLDQASRPKRGLVVQPAVYGLPRNWRTDKLGVVIPGAVVLYELIENHDYLASKDWLNPERTHNITVNVISLIDKKL